MERCYVCNHCGKCQELSILVPVPQLMCLDCQHIFEPGEDTGSCPDCGGHQIQWVSPQDGAQNVPLF